MPTLAGRAALAALLLALQAGAARADVHGFEAETTPVLRYRIDAHSAEAEFSIRVLWLLSKRGQFARVEGELLVDRTAGTGRIAARIDAASAQMPDADDTALLRSPAFFDVDAHPWIEFESAAFSLAAKRRAGQLDGVLRLRGIEREVNFSYRPRPCSADEQAQPEVGCGYLVEGIVRRSRFGMTAYSRTVDDPVRLRFAVRLLASAG